MKRLALLLVIAAGCGSKSAPATRPAVGGSGSAVAANRCVKAGCSGQLCGEPGDDSITTCDMKPEYACYKTAECAVQPDGKCGWTMSDELKGCMASPPPMQ